MTAANVHVLIFDPEADRRCSGNCCRIEGLVRNLVSAARVWTTSLLTAEAGPDPDVVVVRAPAGQPLREVVRNIRSVWKKAAALAAVCNGSHTAAELLDSLEHGLDDFFCCPFREIDFAARLRRVLSGCLPRRSEPQGRPRHLRLDMLVGESPAFLDTIGRIPRIAACAATVLLGGETGVGKELFARAIHYNGNRECRPFVPVNCSALPDHLFENELFGHAKGAYTDASTRESGLLGEADGGTLFLDEVDMLSPSAQAKLLRFLQDREYRPLGSSRPLVADARVIAASNADLRELVAQRQFRQDLFHRLNVLSLEVPPLRSRMSDTPLLAEHFLARFAAQYGRPPVRLSCGALRKLLAYAWPGNVRELEGILHRAVVFSTSDTLEARDIELPVAASAAAATVDKDRAMEEFERSYLVNLLSDHGGNVSRSARVSGKDRRTFQRLLRKHGIERGAFERSA
jgi:DNA-binding NtrC family response regulator